MNRGTTRDQEQRERDDRAGGGSGARQARERERGSAQRGDTRVMRQQGGAAGCGGGLGALPFFEGYGGQTNEENH